MFGRVLSSVAQSRLRLSTRISSNQLQRTPARLRFQVARRHISRLKMETIRNLERDANSNLNSADAQSALLKHLNKRDPGAVVRRVESGEIAVDEAVAQEYFIALAKTGGIPRSQSKEVLRLLRKGSSQSSYGAPSMGIGNANSGFSSSTINGGFSSSAGAGSFENPLVVQFAEKSFKHRVVEALPRFFLFGAAFYLVTSMLDDAKKSSGGGGLGSSFPFGSTKQFDAQQSEKTFDDVCGCDEAKDQLVEIVEYLKDPSRFTRLGGKLPKGVLLEGPPGTGKTLLARAVAGEAGVPFFYASGSEFDEMFVGVGAKRIRALFQAAKQNKPSIIFIDEIDAVGRKRSGKEQQAMNMTLNQLLIELDGFEENDGVIVLAATNFGSSLDPALIRPGRFDRQIAVPLPDIRDRTKILEHYFTTITADPEINAEIVARGTPGFSGAELANICNLAAVRASVLGKAMVDLAEIEFAKDKVLMGDERKSAFISPETQKVTAYHESGHAIVAINTKGAHPVHKATIVPRGRSLGMVMQLPEGDQTSETRQQMLARMDVCMGGRVAEELIFGEDGVTSGASSDFQQATAIARRMVMAYGMVDKVGIVRYSDNDLKELAPDTRKLIDDSIKNLLEQSYARAKACLIKHQKDHDKLAKALIQFETLSGDEIKSFLKGGKIVREVPVAPATSKGETASKEVAATV